MESKSAGSTGSTTSARILNYRSLEAAYRKAGDECRDELQQGEWRWVGGAVVGPRCVVWLESF